MITAIEIQNKFLELFNRQQLFYIYDSIETLGVDDLEVAKELEAFQQQCFEFEASTNIDLETLYASDMLEYYFENGDWPY